MQQALGAIQLTQGDRGIGREARQGEFLEQLVVGEEDLSFPGELGEHERLTLRAPTQWQVCGERVGDHLADRDGPVARLRLEWTHDGPPAAGWS